ncbi:MAG: hypothetical protein ACJ76Y_19905 [Thermoanaerobaculia bacterium]
MREWLRTQNLECVASTATILLQTDHDSGHGLYFSGEVWRVKGKQDPTRSDFSRDRMREHFFRYLEAEPNLPANERDGKSVACYLREKGYCAERTAWISHLMAIDYYQQAEDAGDNKIKMQRLQRASEFLKKDLAFGGFDQIMQSKELDRKIKEALQYLRSS